MVIRVAVRETEGSERLVEEFASLFGHGRVTLRSSGEIELELSGEANEPLNQALTAIERTLEGAGIATAKVWVGEQAYMLERPAFKQAAATPASQFVARSLGRNLSEELSRSSSGQGLTRNGSKKVAVAVAAAFAISCAVGSAGAGAQEECSWGASSVTATLENGQMVETPPQTSGCTS